MTEGLRKGEMMALGAVQSEYAGATCAYRRRDSLQEEFYSNISSAAQRMEGGSENDGKVIGLATFSCGDGNMNFGMKAQYAAESTPEEPVIQVTANCGGQQMSYKVNVNEVNPWTASQLEMFALLSYTDDQGISDGGSLGSYHQLKVHSDNAQMNGIWGGNASWEDFVSAKHDWSAIVVQMADDYFQAGVYSQHLNAMKLNDTLSYYCIRHVDFDNLKIVDKAADKSDSAPEETDDNDLMQLIRERMEELLAMIQSGDTEASFQIGNSSFTIKEWEDFLEKFDDIEDAIRELMRERIEKKTEEAMEEAVEKTTSHEAEEETEEKEKVSDIDVLVSESTKCTYPASTSGQEDIMYITWYTEEGIFCRKAGQREGYEWSVYFENKEDYSKVMEFLNGFDRGDNVRFAAHENFWQDFLKDGIDLEGFLDFYAGTDHGVPGYTVFRDGSMYIDRGKVQWVKYMNSPGNRLYTGEEMMKMQEELIEVNKAKLNKLML